MAMTLVQFIPKLHFKVTHMPSYYYIILACGSVTKVTTHLEEEK